LALNCTSFAYKAEPSAENQHIRSNRATKSRSSDNFPVLLSSNTKYGIVQRQNEHV